MGDLSIETKNISTSDVISGTNSEISDLQQLKVGAGSSIFFTDKEGSRWGHPTFDSAKAWIKVDGTAKFMSSNGDVLLSTGATDGNFVNIINTALNTSSKTILQGFTFGSADYAGAFKTGNITWNEATGAITGGSGSVYNKAGLIFANNGVPTITLNGVTGAATFAGTLAAASGTFAGTVLAGAVIAANINADLINSGTIIGRTLKATNGAGTDVWVSNGGYIDFRYNNVALSTIYTPDTGGILISCTSKFRVNAANDCDIFCDDWNVFFNDDNDGSDCHWIGNGTERMRLSSSGNLTVSGDVSADNIDFAEMFESSDGKKIPVGTSVVFDKEDKIRPAKKGEIPFGAVSGTAALVLGDGLEWSKKYLRNDLGEFIYEEIDFWTVKKKLTAKQRKKYLDNKMPLNGWCDESTPPEGAEIRKEKRKKINPDYNPSEKFITRKEREEWNVVGLIGRVRILNNQPVNPNWLKIRDINENVSEWLIR